MPRPGSARGASVSARLSHQSRPSSESLSVPSAPLSSNTCYPSPKHLAYQMVVLEGGGMLSTSGNQYLQPDYLSPLPTTVSSRSRDQFQQCSDWSLQLDAKKSPLALLAQTCSQIGADTPNAKPLISPLDKPKKGQETRSPSAKADKRTTPTTEPKPVFKPYETTVVAKKEDKPSPAPVEEKPLAATPERKSVSPEAEKAPPKAATPRGASPIIRSGLEILQPKEPLYKPNLGPLPLCCPPTLEHGNPAFRPPFPPHVLGYTGPYLSYARVKTASGGEALVPVCKDPYCTGCQFSALQCPAGCSQCDHQKYNLAMAMAMAPPAPSLAYPQLGRPYVCNWIAGEAYCGKRFVTGEELLQHLRTHTSGSESVFGRYPNPPLSPLSAARYHPYSKPLPSALGASPYSAFNPLYYPYSVYGQRIGAAVHP